MIEGDAPAGAQDTARLCAELDVLELQAGGASAGRRTMIAGASPRWRR